MIPAGIRTTTRERAPTRRQFLLNAAWVASGAVIGSVVGQGVVDPIVEPIAAPIRDALYGRRLVETYRATPLSLRRLDTHGNHQQRLALDAWRQRATMPEAARAKATMTYVGPDGSQWIDWQGGDVARGLWGREHPRHVPMHRQPDPAFGAWAEKRIRAFRDAEEPALVRIGGRVERADGTEGEQSYSVLMLPFGDGAVLTTAAIWPEAPTASEGSTPKSYSRAPAGQGQPRPVSI